MSVGAPLLQALCPHMVRLLHHYEASSNRIFLLLEHVKGGRLIDFVNTKREQWQKLKEAALNPPVSTLLKQRSTADNEEQRTESKSTEEGSYRAQIDSEDSLKALNSLSSPLSESPGASSEPDEIERMLSELTAIVPPSDLPVTSSMGSVDKGEGGVDSSEASDSLDSLALMRRRLQEVMEEKSDKLETTRENSVSGLGSGHGGESSDFPDNSRRTSSNNKPISTAINIQPPTPTVATQTSLGLPDESTEDTSHRISRRTRVGAGDRGEATSAATSALEERTSPRLTPATVETSKDPRSSPTGVPRVDSGRSSGHSSPCFSPGSLRNSPDVKTQVDDWGRRLEGNVRHWAAQLVLALEHLHAHNIVCR